MSAEFLIIGQSGQLAHALGAQLGSRAQAVGRPTLDLASPHFKENLEKLLRSRPYKAIINASAYTQVDLAQAQGREAAMLINCAAVRDMAGVCAQAGIPLIHFSSDYVFNGSGEIPWKESDPATPVNEYGQSKRAGEQAIEASNANYIIFRTSWVYNAHAKNFFTTILRLLGEKDSLNVVADQIGAPTYAPHLAKGALAALEKALRAPEFPSGIYHLCNSGQTSWHGFAQTIFALARSRFSREAPPIRCQQINPITSSAYPLPAPRPLNSRLDCSRIFEAFGVRLPHWEAGLNECFEEHYGSSRLPDPRTQNHPAETAG